jgi:hypothetical protein
MKEIGLLDAVKIRETEVVGFVSCVVDEGEFAVNTGDPDNQPIHTTEELEKL